MTLALATRPQSAVAARHHRWSEDERALIRREFNGSLASCQRISQAMDGVVSRSSVEQQARKLGLTKHQSSKRHSWTEEEDLLLRRDIRPERAERVRLARRIGVTIYQLEFRAARLGLLKATDYMKRFWAVAEDEYLRGKAGQLSPKKMAKHLGRSMNSVVMRLKRLGLSRRNRDGWYTKMDACAVLGKEHKWLQARIDSGALRATYHHGERPAAGGMRQWHIEAKDLRSFIIGHCEELNGSNVDMVALVDLLVGLNGVSHCDDAGGYLSRRSRGSRD